MYNMAGESRNNILNSMKNSGYDGTTFGNNEDL
jgi:hypothetical protein